MVIEGARGILINVTTGYDVTLHELNNAIAEIIHPKADPEANIIFGVVLEDDLENEMHVTILATGFERQSHMDTEIHERPREESRPYHQEESGFDRPAYLSRSSKDSRMFEESQEPQMEAAMAAPERESPPSRKGRGMRPTDVFPAIFGPGSGH